MRKQPARVLMLSAALCLAGMSLAHAADGDDRSAMLKAAYLFNFVKFVQWPNAKPDEAVIVCFIGAGGVQNAFAASIRGKRAGNHPLTIRQLDPAHSPQGCSVLYIDAEAAPAGSAGLRDVDPAVPVLTVSDASEFTRSGGMIELFTARNRLHFNINVDTARRAGLHISSDLLQLAASIEKAGAK